MKKYTILSAIILGILISIPGPEMKNLDDFIIICIFSLPVICAVFLAFYAWKSES